MLLCQSGIRPILCQLMAILAKLLDIDFKYVLHSIYINFDIQTNFEVNQTQISHSIHKNTPAFLKILGSNFFGGPFNALVPKWHKVYFMSINGHFGQIVRYRLQICFARCGIYINFDIQTNFEVNQTQISHSIHKNTPAFFKDLGLKFC